ncbi:MAG: TetR/AcrR family transcriptional regulator [Brevinematales bacterium]|jgi:AcrR family transcriptional regulator
METQKKARELIKDEIRNAAMEIIGKDGFEGMTARKVGKFLGLKNVSLVNYYFKTKENLILETLKKNYFNVMSKIYESMENVKNPTDKLIALFDKMLEIFWHYPALIGLFYFEEIALKGMIRKEYILELIKLQNEIVLRNLNVLKLISKDMNEEEIYLRLFQIRGAVMYPPLAKKTIPDFENYFNDPGKRKSYVRTIVKRICSN